MELVRCVLCDTMKDASEFPPSHIRRRTKNGAVRGGARCRACKAKAERRWRAANPGRYIELQRAARNSKRAKVTEIKVARGCLICGEKHPACLEFHHREQSQKEHNIAHLSASNATWERIEAEILKCEVLCSNCHRKRHWEEGYAAHYDPPAARRAVNPRSKRSHWSGSRKRAHQAQDPSGTLNHERLAVEAETG